VDLERDLVLSAEIYAANQADTHPLVESVMQAKANLSEAGSKASIGRQGISRGGDTPGLRIVVATSLTFQSRNTGTQPRWTDKPGESKRCVDNNRSRTRRAKSNNLQRRPSRCANARSHISAIRAE
jgi:hypothetical protein